MRNVPKPIFIEIVPFILRPIITFKMVEASPGVCQHLKSISNKVVIDNFVIRTVALDFHGFAVEKKLIVFNFDSVCPLCVDAYGVFLKRIARHQTVTDFFQKDPIGRSPPVFSEPIVQHPNILAKHHRYASIIFFKGVCFIYIEIGKHKMKAISVVSPTQVVTDQTFVDELEIYPVPMLNDLVIDDLNSLPIPDMDGVAGPELLHFIPFYKIVPHDTIARFLKINPKKIIIQLVSFNNCPFDLHQFNRSPVFDITYGNIFQHQSPNEHIIRSYDEDFLPRSE